MEISPYTGLPELQMEDSNLVNQWMNSLDELGIPLEAAFAGNLHHSLSQQHFNLKTYVETFHPVIDRPEKHLKTNSRGSSISDPIANFSTNKTLSFVNSKFSDQIGNVKRKEEAVSSKDTAIFPPDVLISQGSHGNQNYFSNGCQGMKRTSSAARSSQTQDHIIAERKRREKLAQRFIALSAIIPGLKKTDKASVLGDAIKYLKHLQDQVKILEEQTRKKTVESVVFVKKSQLFACGDNSLSDENFSEGPSDEALPEIEARFSDKDVLIRVHYEKKKGSLEKIIAEIEKLNLIVVNSSILTFGSSALDVTIIAQMDTEFCMTLKDFVKTLRFAFQQFM